MSDPRPLTEAERDRVDEVLSTHRSFIEAVARQYAPSPQEVPDIIQNVAFKVCRGLGDFRGDAKLTTWLFRVTVNEARIIFRRQTQETRKAERFAQQPEPIEDPDQVVAQNDRRRAVMDAVADLPYRQRRCLTKAVRANFENRSILLKNKRFRSDVRTRLRTRLAEDPRMTE